MEQTYKYRVYPSEAVANEARRHIDICRQVYNHSLGQHRAAPNDEKPSYTTLQNRLPTWKKRWPECSDVYSKSLQMAVRRLFNSRKALRGLQSNGYGVGELKWKSPSEYSR
ncbi:helix-turn-helix domain-containing protein [Natronomonas salina]|uniref:helix-turn-helix domain-containing protein n=1 Tax=Natronomonas salina TaxID=1710540 RepID=UPI0015B415C1|nr:helix-turn-helix domain-containing protein [Natronomonas salina]